MAGYCNVEGGDGGFVFLGIEKKIPKYPVEICKGIKDLFSEIYRNHVPHLPPHLYDLEHFGDEFLGIFFVFAITHIRVDFGYQIFVGASYFPFFEPQFLHSLTD